MFIGYYNLANFITLFGMASALGSMFLAVAGEYKAAIIALLIAGLSDMFDGRVARRSKKHTQKSKMFGIQIDTVCDMASFGIAPAVIAFTFGMNEWYDIIILVLYASCGAIRLAYFNTQAILETEDLNLRTFTGVPIPTICLVLTIISVLMTFVPSGIMVWAARGAYILTGALFISNFRIKKPNLTVCLIIIAVMVSAVAALLFCGDIKPFA